MARTDKNGMIDGFMAVQSVRRSSGRQHERDRTGTPAHDEAPATTPSTAAPASKPHGFGHTALPTKHQIHCYACGYQFVATGSLERILCPKCKEQLHTGDKTICGPYSGTIQTVGTVTIHSGAVVTDSVITASVIRIAGECRQTRLQPGIRVELDTGAVVDQAKLEAVDVVIPAKHTVTLETELHCKSLQLMGSLRADVRARERVEMHSSAVFYGKILSPGLIIEDGAALRAELHIGPQPAPENTQAKKAQPVEG